MAKRSKSYRNVTRKTADSVLYSPLETICLTEKTSTTKFDATVEVAFHLGIDPRKADQMVRGTINLPHGTGKTARILVFTVGPCTQETIDTGVDGVGGDELAEKIAGGYTDLDAAVMTPDLMGKVGRLGCVLGPRGLMPNPRTGTVTMDVAKAVSDIKDGRIEFRVDENGNLPSIVGKTSFTPEQLAENCAAAQKEVLHLRPSMSKGRYLFKGTVVTTMGPGIPLDMSKARNLISEDPS